MIPSMFLRPNSSIRPTYFFSSPRIHSNTIGAPRFTLARGFGSAAALDKHEVAARVIAVVKNFHRVGPSVEVKENSHFTHDLGLDSLDAVEVVMALEDEFSVEIADTDADRIHTPADAVKFILSHPNAK